MFASNIKEKIRHILHLDEPESEGPINIQMPTSDFEQDFDITPISIIYLDNKWEIERINMAAVRMFSAQAGSLEGKSIIGFIESGFEQIFLDNIRIALATGEKRKFDIKLRKIHGQVFPAQCEIIPVFDEYGKFRHFRTVISDMTPAMNSSDLIY